MGNRMMLEEKHHHLEEVLRKNLVLKRSVEVKIRKQLEELKRLEASIEKNRFFSENQPLQSAPMLSGTEEWNTVGKK